MTEIIEKIGTDGRKVHVLFGRSIRLYVIENEEGTQILLESSEMKDIARLVEKYEEVEE